MSTAETFFSAPDDVNTGDIELGASSLAESNIVTVLDDVEYTTYTFEDRSKLTFGSNGYIGCETPA